MKMKITSRQINDIAQELEMGMKVYINRETQEIKPIFDWEDSIGDTEIWEEEEEKIEKEWSDFVIISKMESWEAFKIMEAFVDKVEDRALNEDLVRILGRKSPFANFKATIESSPYRQNWFDFRQGEYESYVKEKLEMEGFDLE